MTTELSDRDARVRAAVRSHIAAQPVPPPDLARIVARAEGGGRPRRRRSVWMAQAVAATVAVVVCGTVTAVVTLARTETRYGVAPVFSFSPDEIPDFATLPGAEAVWPSAARRLPAALPDGALYRVADTTDGDEVLVVPDGRAAGPLFFDTRTGAVRAVAPDSVTNGLAAPSVSTARIAGDRVVWFVSGRRGGQPVREAWSVPLDGGEATRLADPPAAAVDGKVVLAGDVLIWEEYGPGQGQDDVRIRQLPLDGGPVGDVPGSRGYWLSTVPGFITSQYPGTPFGEPERTGELVDVATGKRYRWNANDEMLATVACGPAWCTGWTVGERVALQDIDGREFTELKAKGALEPGLDGRFAIGHLDQKRVVWDRDTGRAGVIEEMGSPLGVDPTAAFRVNSDPRSLVQTWIAKDGTFTMLDLRRIR